MQQKKLKYLNTLNELQARKDAENYNQLITQLDNDQKILIHDFKNHFTTMKTLISEESYEEALKYADDMITSPAITANGVLTDNPTLTVILSRYLAICRKKSISAAFNVKNARFSIYTPGDITSLFGNLLDNSVEACLNSSDPYIDLEIGWNEEKLSNVIVLSNSCETAPIPGKNGDFITQKKDAASHGIGIKSVKRTVLKYHGLLYQYFDKENHSFTTIITIGKDEL
ncbi:MAG: sensor histidine kinase [Eubacterium sp.]|nr:sensor histidine kinase [Eubacterium sp.]